MEEAVELVRMAPADDVRVVAVLDALAPYVWRSLTAVSVCRRAVAAMDSVAVGGFVGRFGSPDTPEECVDALVEHVGGCRWRSLTVEGLSRLIVGAADAWQQERAWFDIHLGLLLDGAG